VASHMHFKLPPLPIAPELEFKRVFLHKSAFGVPLPRNLSAERSSLTEDKSVEEFSEPSLWNLGFPP